MKNSQSVENNHNATERAVEFMKVYGLALLFMVAVSVLVNVHPGFSGKNHPAIQQGGDTASPAAVAQAASGQLGKRILEVKWDLF